MMLLEVFVWINVSFLSFFCLYLIPLISVSLSLFRVSGSSSSHSDSEPVSPTSPSTLSSLSSPLSSPSSPVFILQSPPLPPSKIQTFTPISPPLPPPGPTKTRSHPFCNHVTLRRFSSTCNPPPCAVGLMHGVERDLKEPAKFWGRLVNWFIWTFAVL